MTVALRFSLWLINKSKLLKAKYTGLAVPEDKLKHTLDKSIGFTNGIINVASQIRIGSSFRIVIGFGFSSDRI